MVYSIYEIIHGMLLNSLRKKNKVKPYILYKKNKIMNNAKNYYASTMYFHVTV